MNSDRLARIAAFSAFLVACGFFTFLAAMAWFRPLCCADDAAHAVMSKNLARGLGYALNKAPLGTGPTSILPAAAAIAVLGPHPAVPGMTHIVLTFALLAITIVLVRGGLDRASRSALVILFLLLSAATGAYHLEQWYAQLGEVPAALLVILGSVLWAFHRPRWLGALLCGITFGLAVLSKHVAAIYVVGPLAVVVIGFLRRPSSEAWRYSVIAIAPFLVGFTAPLLAFEAWKLTRLGYSGWIQHWQEFRTFLASQGVSSDKTIPLSVLILERAAVLSVRFALPMWLLLGSLIVLVLTSIRDMDERYRGACSVLLIGFLTHLAYWTLVSIGWPRYLYIGVVVYCFLVALAASASTSRVTRAALIGCVCGVAILGFPRLGFQLKELRQARASAESDIRSAKFISATLATESSPVPVTTQWWAHVAALEYLSPVPGTFRRYGAGGGQELPVDLIVVNERYLRASDSAFLALMARCNNVIAERRPYKLLRCPAELPGLGGHLTAGHTWTGQRRP